MFQFRVAFALGFGHADHWLATLTNKQYQEAVAFYSIEPIGDERADIRSGLAAMSICNAFGVRPRARLENFLPFRDKPEVKDEDELLRKMEELCGDGRGNQHEFHSNNREL